MLTLWASIVAERLGYPSTTALTLGRAVAGYSAQAMARRLALVGEHEEPQGRQKSSVPRETVLLLGRRVPIMATEDGEIRAGDHGKPAPERTTLSYNFTLEQHADVFETILTYFSFVTSSIECRQNVTYL